MIGELWVVEKPEDAGLAEKRDSYTLFCTSVLGGLFGRLNDVMKANQLLLNLFNGDSGVTAPRHRNPRARTVVKLFGALHHNQHFAVFVIFVVSRDFYRGLLWMKVFIKAALSLRLLSSLCPGGLVH